MTSFGTDCKIKKHLAIKNNKAFLSQKKTRYLSSSVHQHNSRNNTKTLLHTNGLLFSVVSVFWEKGCRSVEDGGLITSQPPEWGVGGTLDSRLPRNRVIYIYLRRYTRVGMYTCKSLRRFSVMWVGIWYLSVLFLVICLFLVLFGIVLFGFLV